MRYIAILLVIGIAAVCTDASPLGVIKSDYMMCHNRVAKNASLHRVPCYSTPFSSVAGIKSIKIDDCRHHDDGIWRCNWIVNSRSFFWDEKQSHIVGTPSLTCDENWDIVRDGMEQTVVGCWFNFHSELSDKFIHFLDLPSSLQTLVVIITIAMTIGFIHICSQSGVQSIVIALLLAYIAYVLELPAVNPESGTLIIQM